MSCPKLGSFDFLLHPKIIEASLNQYHDGYLRDAVLNSIMILFDTIRQRTGLTQDGEKLINEAFALDSPYLVFSHLNTETGMNDQKGFMQILRGAYQGVKNTSAHTLDHDFTHHTAAQYLVFASLLMRRIGEAIVAERD